MTQDSKTGFEDDLFAQLANLPAFDAETGRIEQIRVEAHAVLARHRRRTGSWKTDMAQVYSRFLEPALVSGLAAFYLLWAFERALFVLAVYVRLGL